MNEIEQEKMAWIKAKAIDLQSSPVAYQ